MNGQSHSRPLSVAVFENERTVQPRIATQKPWNDLSSRLQVREHRPNKSGPMLGGYALSGTRKCINVVHRSLIQLDIDSAVERDEDTGDILRVTMPAPEIGDLRTKINDLEWIAASSHSHESFPGLSKYRVTILPDRDIQPDEHRPVLEALDDLLGGCLDRGAWPLSQAFYLPSCPAKVAREAFAIHNQGRALAVDEIVARGRAIIAGRAGLPPQSGPILRTPRPLLSEDQNNVAIVTGMVMAVSPDVPRSEWLKVLWALASMNWKCGESIARNWSMGSQSKWNPNAFASAWSSYDPSRPDAIDLGALDRLARAHGYTGPLPPRPADSDGRGADVANGKLFAEMHRDRLLHVHDLGKWLRFEPVTGWIAAPPLEQDRAAKAVIARLREHAAQQITADASDDRIKRLVAHLQYSSKATSVRAMIEMARSEPGMTRRASDLDADPNLLGVANGVLDLNKGALLQVSPQVLVSRRCRVHFDPGAACPAFDQFLVDVQPDPEMRAFLQKWAGYCLTGHVTEQKFAFLFGSGANGKSVFIELIAWILGDYARRIQTEMLMHHQRSPQAPSPDIVALKGVRFAYANETEEGRRLADGRVKDLTGGDTLVGRVPYGKANISFQPTHKLVLAGNHKPHIGDLSDGMWRRVLLVGFEVTIPESKRDPRLLEVLKAEGSGVLNWALAGHQQWRGGGLSVPTKVRQATAIYRDEQDILAEWIVDRCVIGVGLTVSKTELYADYRAWMKAHGHGQMGSSRLTRRLNERGYKVQPDKRTVAGLRLKLSGIGCNL